MEALHYVNSLVFQADVTSKLLDSLEQNFYGLDVKNDVTFEEYVILDTLVCYPHINTNIVVQLLRWEPVRVEKIFDSLIKKKLLQKVKVKTQDVTTKYYELTKLGNNVYQEISPKQDKVLITLSKFLTEKELVSFTKTLFKIKNVLISLST